MNKEKEFTLQKSTYTRFSLLGEGKLFFFLYYFQ